jgi:hypothetical protein
VPRTVAVLEVTRVLVHLQNEIHRRILGPPETFRHLRGFWFADERSHRG